MSGDESERKLFTWFDIERILSKVSAEKPETIAEYLAWLRAVHTFAINSKRVFSTSSNLHNFSTFDRLGYTTAKTMLQALDEYARICIRFPGIQLLEFERIVQELLSSFP